MQDNKFIQRARMIKYFVDSAVEIIGDQGFQGVSLRKVADRAGYNSATLYNYFENLDHLLLFASLTYLKDYIEDIQNYIYDAKNAVDVYAGVWYCFIDHAFNNPEAFGRIFFTELKHDQAHYISSYYSYFPLKVGKYPKEIRTMLEGADISTRSGILLQPALEAGLLEATRSEKMDRFIVYSFEAILYDVARRSIEPGRAKEVASQAFKDLLYYVGGYEHDLNVPVPYL